MQGVLFFFAFFLLTTLASLPLDLIGHHYSRAYGISVQGWGSWWGDQGKGLALALVIGTLILLLFNWMVERWPRRYWFGYLADYAAPDGPDPVCGAGVH